MKFNKIFILTIILLTILSLSAVSAQNDLQDDLTSFSYDDNQLKVDNDDKTSSGDYDKSVYVDADGDDKSSGSQSSPYASISKAISDVNASQKAVIYINEGTYMGENNTDLSINLAHKQNGGSLTIIGNGKTVVNANGEGQFFKSISADSIVTLINITFINGKADDGSAIYNSGELTIDGCVFANNYAIDEGTIYQAKENNLTIRNSKFINNTGYNAVDVYFHEEALLVLINNEFIGTNATGTSGSYGSSVEINNGKSIIRGNVFKNILNTKYAVLYDTWNNNEYTANITDNVFINCTYDGTSHAIVAAQNSYFKNNTFINCTSDKGFIYVNTDYNAYLIFDNVVANTTQFILTAKVCDDMGNPVRNAKVHFTLNGVKTGMATSNNGTVSVSVEKLLDNGDYVISGYQCYDSNTNDNPFELNVKTGTLTVDFDQTPIHVWISPDGDDENGNGSKANPFKTVKHALDYGLNGHVEVFLHIAKGTYAGENNTGLTYTNIARIHFIGESGPETIFDAESQRIFFAFTKNCIVSMKNLTLINGKNEYRADLGYNRACLFGSIFSIEDSIIKDSEAYHCSLSDAGETSFYANNLTVINCAQFWVQDATIYNSMFCNSSGNFMGILRLVSKTSQNVIVNTTFANIVTTSNSGSPAIYGENLVSMNNYYFNNSATYSSTSSVPGAVSISGDSAIFINDRFVANSATGDGGYAGALSIRCSSKNANVTLRNVTFKDNRATSKGGALDLYGGNIINCTFENNTASLGGAIHLPNHSNSSVFLYDIVLENVVFKNNNATTNGDDIYITPSSSATTAPSNVLGMTITFNDLSTTHLQDTVSAVLTHKSGAKIGGGAITFYLDGSKMGVANVVNGVCEFAYLGFKDGDYSLSGVYDVASSDAVYKFANIHVALSGLKDNVTLYVSDLQGSDENGNGSLNNPYKTIETALNKGFEQSNVVNVYVLEGTYRGISNTNITVFSSVSISIIGAGKNKTIIDGENKNWFLNILSGTGGSVNLYNMTIVNMSTNYMPSRAIGTSAIRMEENTKLKADNVEFIACHGNNGGAILSKGDIVILNSYFFNNGDSNYGGAINSEGKLTIYNSTFIANHAKWAGAIWSTGELFIADSLIQDTMSVNGGSKDTLAIGSNKGNVTIINTIILRTGKTCAELIGTGQTWANNPDFTVSVNGERVKFINSTIDGYDKNYFNMYHCSIAFSSSIQWNTVYKSPDVLEVYNSKFYNLNKVMVGTNGYSIYDSCIFENITYFATTAIRLTSANGNVDVVNSYFADGTFQITKNADTNFTFNNNWWGTNDKPTYTEASEATNPTSWLILTLNVTDDGSLTKDIVLAFKSFDGENITDWDGSLYPRVFTIDGVNGTFTASNGTITNNVVSKFTLSAETPYFVNATVDGQSVNLTRSVLELSATANPIYVGQNVTVVITGSDNLTGRVYVVIDGVEFNATSNGLTAIANIAGINSGNYTAYVVYAGDDKYAGKNISIPIQVKGIILNVSNVIKYYSASDKLVVRAVGSDGVILANQNITLTVGDGIYTKLTDSNGIAEFDLDLTVGEYVASIKLNTTEITANVTVKTTVISADVVKTYNAAYDFKVTFLDANGNPLNNTAVKFTVNGKTIEKTTDANGVAALTKADIGSAIGTYKITSNNPVTNETVSNNVKILSRFSGNKNINMFYYDGTSYKVRVFDDNGNPVGAGQVVAIKVGSKTYKVKTDKNGYATLKINLLPKSKAYTIAATYKGQTVKNTLKVKQVLSSKKTVKVKKSARKLVLKATLKQGKKPIKGKKITFKFKGKNYAAKTNKNGVAKVTIKKSVLKKLKAGKKYAVKISYIKDAIKSVVKVKR